MVVGVGSGINYDLRKLNEIGFGSSTAI